MIYYNLEAALNSVPNNRDSKLEVEFRVKSNSKLYPKEVLSLTKTGKLSRKAMTKTQYYDLVQDYVLVVQFELPAI